MAFTDKTQEEVVKGFGFPPKKQSIIMVLGVGGAGGNAVNHMYDLGISDVTFMVCNTDRQALNVSPVPIKVQLGEGLGAGNDPEKGRKAAIESIDDIVMRFEQEGTKMVFITAGMGGGTGTGAAPVIAKAARDRGILTVGIVTLPFKTEGPKRVNQADKGLHELRSNVDSLVVIHNDNISRIYGSLPLEEAFSKADDILATAAKGISELITRESIVNVDFADVQAVMSNSGMALMGSGRASGDDKIHRVTEAALSSPLLNNLEIKGARDILFNLAYGANQISFEEATQVLELIQKRASRSIGDTNMANIIWGAGADYSLDDDELVLTIVATGFESISLDPGGKAAGSGAGIRAGGVNSPIGAGKGPASAGQKSNVITVNAKERFANIEKYLETPAYYRRGVRLAATPARGTKVAIKDDTAQQDAPHKEGDLFG